MGPMSFLALDEENVFVEFVKLVTVFQGQQMRARVEGLPVVTANVILTIVLKIAEVYVQVGS